MKCYGKVAKWDGYGGIIIGSDGISYMCSYVDFIDKDIKMGDYVFFDKDVYEDVELTRYIARFIKRVKEVNIKD